MYGETSLAKHICLNRSDAILVGGRAHDLKYAISKRVKAGKEPRIVTMNITRSMEQYVSYEGTEAAKDGIFFSGKYKGGMCVYNSPHIIIFANFKPRKKALSAGRWNIHHLRR